ncbi:hypothetical protein RhiirA1_465496 [Rhizophagus irregularis]|uniref:F-box domain-containing protein n=2 Tax=Rhizophagus irregularis TaxID=588596 RepID=A0A2N0RFT5_9GLOM|nr:hypothetical protein RhiirA1_465496 [Rhizophagus irregularis]
MSKLNKDIFYLIFEELQNDNKALYSSLLVNKTLCEIIVPILWRNPWKYLANGNKNLLLNVIISHLSDESKNNLKIQGVNLPIVLSQKLLFNYISFCRHLNLYVINSIINNNYSKYKSKISFIKKEIFNIFINKNTKFTHLYLPQRFDYQIHLIPGAKQCLSKIVSLSCYTRINDKVLIGLAEICQSIKKLELFIEEKENNYGITKLIDASKTLIDVRLITDYGFCNDFIINYSYTSIIDVAFHIILENSLIKHAHTLQYIKMTTPPKTKILSFLVNLKKLELYVNNQNNNSNNLGNIFLPSLQILKSNVVKINILRNLFVNTNGNLIKIGIDDIPHNEIDNKNIIQAIYQNCPNLMYLKLMIRNESILELEQLLINCQYLVGLYFFAIKTFDWDELFKVLTISSPTSLIKFKFNNILSYGTIKLESLKLFFDNWKGRNPISLQFDSYNGCSDLIDLIGEYKLEGIINKFDHLHGSNYFEDFEW